MAALLDEAARCCGIPRARLSIAKPPTVGSKTLTPKLVASLKWDDPKLLACPKVGSHPLQLRDGDLVLLRDAGASHESKPHPKPAPAKAARGNKFPTVSVAGGAAPREAGLRITTCYDVPLGVGTAAAAQDATEITEAAAAAAVRPGEAAELAKPITVVAPGAAAPAS